jgi:hypothetical protein
MTSLQPGAPVRRIPPLAPWALMAGGLIYFLGGSLHPRDDVEGVGVKERVLPMFRDDAWYPSHTLLLVGTGLIAIALVLIALGRSFADVRRAHTALLAAAAASVAATLGTALHLATASEADHIASHGSTPLTDLNTAVETVTAPAFGLTIAVLAVVGAATRTFGNRTAAVLAVIGGVGYALAGGTFAFTDALDPLFPIASLFGPWAVVTAVSLLRRSAHLPHSAPAPAAEPLAAS